MSKKTREWHKKLKEALYWNQFLRLILEASLELSIGVIYNLKVEKEAFDQDPDNWDFYKPDLPFFWINLISSIIIAQILVFGPIFILCYYLYKFK